MHSLDFGAYLIHEKKKKSILSILPLPPSHALHNGSHIGSRSTRMRAGLEAFFSFLSPKHWIGGRKGGGLELLSPVLRRKKREKKIRK